MTGIINDYFEEIASGKHPEKSRVYKFGENNVVGTTELAVWNAGATYVYLSAAAPMEILSDSANDTILGSGARTIQVFGVDADFNAIDEVVEMNGVTAVTLVNEYLRVFRAYVLTTGTPLVITGANAGDITIQTVTGSTPQAFIKTGTGQTLMSIFTIPSGFTGYVWSATALVGKGKEVKATLKTRFNNATNDAPFRVRASRSLYQNAFTKNYKVPTAIPEKTDILFTAVSEGTSVSVATSFELVLIKN